MLKIKTIDEFEDLKKRCIGFIVVTDYPNNTRKLHEIKCPHVDVVNFTKKVINNREENSSYYWFENKSNALKDMNAEECLVCKK